MNQGNDSVRPHTGLDGTVEHSVGKDSIGSEVDATKDPYVGMEFESEEAAEALYIAYARRMGFSTRANPARQGKRDDIMAIREFVCVKEGFRVKKDGTEIKIELPKSVTRIGCKAMLTVQKQESGKWTVTQFEKEHNHPLATPTKLHCLRPRRIVSAAKTPVETYVEEKVTPKSNASARKKESRVMSNSNPAFIKRDPRIFTPIRQRTLGREAQSVLDYFKRMQAENPAFFYAIQVDGDQRISNVFWSDARSRIAYNHFGDVVTLDTRYRTHRYRIPFAYFTGVNHHRQPVVFGCALLLDESEASFTWLFKTWLSAMFGRHPTSIITDQDQAIQGAVAQVFPKTRHRFCKWHILREGQEKLAHVCRANPTFEGEFYNCINLVETVDEFESSWSSLLDKYNLKENDWLQSIYNLRRQWVPVYLRDTFFAEMPSTDGNEIMGSLFDGYVNADTTLQIFIKQYEKALDSGYRKEVEADYETVYSVPDLKTPSPMEKQAADIYTRSIFENFQEELIETFVYTADKIEEDWASSTYWVTKFEEDHKACTVTFNVSKMRAGCSCRLFEFSGILCRHVLTVFRVKNIFTLPGHYILKRWTRNAKSGAVVDDQGVELQGNSGESLTMRHNNLYYEAIKYAEEGAASVDIYNVAMCALREAVKKVAAAKKNAPKVPQLSPPSGNNQEDNIKKTPVTTSELSATMWPRPENAIPRFNLNDVGAPAPAPAPAPTPAPAPAPVPVPTFFDAHLPRMSLVSLQWDDGPYDNMIILPRLKSMTWSMENRSSMPANRVAVINLKLQDYTKAPSGEAEVKFQLSRDPLETMLRSMAYITDQLSAPNSMEIVLNLKLQDYTRNPSPIVEVKFQLSRETLEGMLRSMAYIREQLSNIEGPPSGSLHKRQRH
eukprot:TRINITY_DN5490_c0_g1_i1.p1 TRINITY_DN5490_c0_g1~~TRINITY_DN5490_c0_g1_i1.p1  ORF type:complete len:893 (-),score=156.19 TRINITY_DN5490_c0_g1_i1:335-3013(-)